MWGTAADELENIVWGTVDDGENIVWGTADDGENIVWGTRRPARTSCGARPAAATTARTSSGAPRWTLENIVWGTADDGENIVWGTNMDLENIVWGTADGPRQHRVGHVG